MIKRKKKSQEKINEERVLKEKDWNFYLHIWRKRRHYCENCNKWLGSEPLTIFFDHSLEKSKFPDLRYEEENIMLLCLSCHGNKTNGKLTKKIEEKIEIVREKFGK